jgi:hypothetical protein
MQLSAVGDLESRPVSWLWPGRLALGKLAMLDGDPGLVRQGELLHAVFPLLVSA